MNREDHLHNLDALASSLDMPAAPVTSARPRVFWLQITAAVLAGSVVSVGSLLLLQAVGLLPDMSPQPARQRLQNLAAPALAVPAASMAPVANVAAPVAPPVALPVPAAVTAPAPALSSADAGARPAIPAAPAASLTPAAVPPIAGQPQPAVPNAAPAALVTAATTPVPLPNAMAHAGADRQQFAERQTVENLAAAVDALTLKVAELEKISLKRAKAASAAAQQLKATGTDKAPVSRARSEELALPIFAISPTGVLVSDKGKPRLVPPGDKLPGGMTFLNFDPVTRRMKTDQGEFDIPALTP